MCGCVQARAIGSNAVRRVSGCGERWEEGAGIGMDRAEWKGTRVRILHHDVASRAVRSPPLSRSSPPAHRAPARLPFHAALRLCAGSALRERSLATDLTGCEGTDLAGLLGWEGTHLTGLLNTAESRHPRRAPSDPSHTTPRSHRCPTRPPSRHAYALSGCTAGPVP